MIEVHKRGEKYRLWTTSGDGYTCPPTDAEGITKLLKHDKWIVHEEVDLWYQGNCGEGCWGPPAPGHEECGPWCVVPDPYNDDTQDGGDALG